MTSWQLLTSGLHTFTQSLSRRRSLSCLTAMTSTSGQDAAGDCGVACTERDRAGRAIRHKKMIGTGPSDASEIVMLNPRVQWTEEGIRMSRDPRHVKDIIEELGLEGAKPADTPKMMVSQSGKMDSDSRALSSVPQACGPVELLGNGSPRYSLSLHRSWESRIKPERRGHGQTQEWGAF